MRRRLWLIVLCLYFVAGAIDMAASLVDAHRTGRPLTLANVAVALCAGLFWPLDVVARPLLGSR